MKKIILSLLLAILCCVGCQPTQQSPKTDKDVTTDATTDSTANSNEPLLVFTGPACDLLIQNFRNAYPDVNIEVKTSYKTIQDMTEKYGEPDIILESSSLTDFQGYYEMGVAADITSFYEEDDQLDQSQYFKGAMEVGRVDDQLVALPITIEIPYMTISEGKWENSAFATLPEKNSALDMLSAMNVELDKAYNQENYPVFGGEFVDMAGWLFSIGAIQKEETGWTIDPELFEALYQMQRKMYININSNQPVYEQSPVPIPISWSMGWSLGNAYLAVSYGHYTAPQTGILLETSIQAEQNKEEVKVIWRPAAQDSNTYLAEMCGYGMVGANSTRKQEAYDILRKMMDTPISVWAVSRSSSENTMCPIHLENAKELLEVVETQGADRFLQNNPNERGTMVYDVPKADLSEEMENSICDVLDHIVLYQEDRELAAKINERVNLHIENNSTDSKDCYQEVLQIIQDYYGQ